MYAAESNAPEGRDAQAPDLRGGCVYGHGSRRCVRPRMRGGAKRPADVAQAPETPPSFRSAALELSASCVRAGFPPAPRRGRV